MQLLLIIAALIVLTLLLASIYRRYQMHLDNKRAAMQRLANNAGLLSSTLDALKPLPIKKEVRVLLRQEVIECLNGIKRLNPKLKDIETRIKEAEGRVNSEQSEAGIEITTPDTEEELNRIIEAIELLISFFAPGRMLTKPDSTRRTEYKTHLQEIRAELRYHFFTESAAALYQEGKRDPARSQLKRLMRYFQQLGPNTTLLRERYGDVEQRFHDYATTPSAALTTPDKGEAPPAATPGNSHPRLQRF